MHTTKIMLCVLASVALLQSLYWYWPRSVCFDDSFSLFAAQNAIHGNGFVTIDPGDIVTGDLSKIRMHWLTAWPPGLSLIYFLLLSAGLSAGGATNAIVTGVLFFGTIGWLVLMRRAGASDVSISILGSLTPWMYFLGSAFVVFLSDYFIWAVAPWCFLLLLKLSQSDEHPASLYKIALTGFAFGLLGIFKYSALPIIIGAGLFFVVRDRRLFNRRRLWHTAIFAGTLISPGLILCLANKILTGTATSQINFAPSVHTVTLTQVWNVLVIPMFDLSGWSAIAWHAKWGGRWLFEVPAAIVFVVAVGQAFGSKAATVRSYFVLLVVMTGTMWLFLIGLAAISGDVGEWTTQGRYTVPVIFGWYCTALIAVLDGRATKSAGVILASVLLAPLLAGIIALAVKPLRQAPPLTLPYSRLASTLPRDAKLFQTLRDGLQSHRRPDLIISTRSEIMNELLVPTLPWFRVEKLERLYSAKPMVLWVVLDQTSMKSLKAKLDSNVIVEDAPMANESQLRFAALTWN